ncbi:HigA family addiction module antitoxin [Amphritea sp. HPY]|uniref:HigA family addiction module antitoxin n=1 Tax=Amphritea sp. HPY TaxID=3421652 RepID=UPI003D7C6642
MTTEFRIPGHEPTSVGVMLKEEFLEPLNITQGQLAKAMGVGRKTVNELCGNKRAITVETAFLLAKVLGTTPEFWINLQIINNIWGTQHSEKMQHMLDNATVLVAA